MLPVGLGELRPLSCPWLLPKNSGMERKVSAGLRHVPSEPRIPGEQPLPSPLPALGAAPSPCQKISGPATMVNCP